MRIKIVWRTIDGEPEAEVRIWRGDVFLMPALFVLYAAGLCPFLFYPLKWIPGLLPILVAVTLLGTLGSWDVFRFRERSIVHRRFLFGLPRPRRVLGSARIESWVEPFTNEARIEIGEVEIPMWTGKMATELSESLRRVAAAMKVRACSHAVDGQGQWLS